MAKRILITGSGMVASALAYFAPQYGHTVFTLRREDLDVTDKLAVRNLVREARPNLILHTAALTKVNYCQENPQEALLINREGTSYVVAAAEQLMADFVYFSTDYVFNGMQNQPWVEDDRPDPLNAYGMSKLAGEQVTRAYHRGFIVRTSGVFGARLDGVAERNFVRAIAARLEQPGDDIRVVADQTTALTYAGHLASMVLSMISEGLPSVVHLTSAGKDSWYGWARRIAEILGHDQGRISPVSSREYDAEVPRPANSVLASQFSKVAAMISMHPADMALREYLDWLARSGQYRNGSQP